jgi:hypothetical protein
LRDLRCHYKRFAVSAILSWVALIVEDRGCIGA